MTEPVHVIRAPFQITSNLPNWFIISRRSLASANIRRLLGYFLNITLFTTSRFLTMVESVSITNERVFGSMVLDWNPMCSNIRICRKLLLFHC